MVLNSSSPPISPSPSSLHPPTSFKPKSLLRRASGVLRGTSPTTAAASSTSPSTSTATSGTLISSSGSNGSSLNQSADGNANGNGSGFEADVGSVGTTTMPRRRMSLSFLKGRRSSSNSLELDGGMTGMATQPSSSTCNSTSNNSISTILDSKSDNPSNFALPFGSITSTTSHSTSFQSTSTLQIPQSPPPTNSKSNYLSPKAASLLFSPEERAFRGSSLSPTTPTPSFNQHLTPEECAFRGIQYVPPTIAPPSPNTALFDLATGGGGGKWERFRNAVSSRSKGREREGSISRDGDRLMSSSPIGNEGHSNMGASGTPSKAEKLLGISSDHAPSYPSTSKSDRFLGISNSSSDFLESSQRVGHQLVVGGRSRAPSDASRFTTTAASTSNTKTAEMERSESAPVRNVYSIPMHSIPRPTTGNSESSGISSNSHPYLQAKAKAEIQNRNRSSSTASSFFNGGGTTSSVHTESSSLGLGLSRHATEDSDFLNLGEGKEGDESSSSLALGFYPNVNQEKGDGDESFDDDDGVLDQDGVNGTPASEFQTFFPSLNKKESRDRLKEIREREKEKERERMEKLNDIRRMRKEKERRLRENSNEEKSDGVEGKKLGQYTTKEKEIKATQLSAEKVIEPTDYSKKQTLPNTMEPMTPVPPPSSWNQNQKLSSISPAISTKSKGLSALLGSPVGSSDLENEVSVEKKKKKVGVHAADLMAEFNLEKPKKKETNGTPKKKKGSIRGRSSDGLETKKKDGEFETPKKFLGGHRRESSTPKAGNGIFGAASSGFKNGTQEPAFNSSSFEKGVDPFTQPVFNRKPVKGLFESLDQDQEHRQGTTNLEDELDEDRTVSLRPRLLSKTSSIRSRKRLSSLHLSEGFDLVLDSDLDARTRARDAMKEMVDEDSHEEEEDEGEDGDGRTCASSDFEGEGLMMEDPKVGDFVERGYASAEEGEPSPSDTDRFKDPDGEDADTSSLHPSFVTAANGASTKDSISRNSSQHETEPLPPLPTPKEAPIDPQLQPSSPSIPRALATLSTLPPLASLVEACLSAELHSANSKPASQLWKTPNLSNSNSTISKGFKLLSSSSNKDLVPKSWIGYVRSYAKGELDLSNPPKPRAAPIVSFPTPRSSHSPSFEVTGGALRHQRSSSSFARFEGFGGTAASSNFPNSPVPISGHQTSLSLSSPLPIPPRNDGEGRTSPLPISFSSPLFGSSAGGFRGSNSNLPRPSPNFNGFNNSYGCSPKGRVVDERMRMSQEDEEIVRREAQEIQAVGGEGDIRAPRPPFEAERQISVKPYLDALKLDSSSARKKFEGLDLVINRLAQDLDVQCSGITLLGGDEAYLLAKVGMDEKLERGLGFKMGKETLGEHRQDPKLRHPSALTLDGLGVLMNEDEEREELVEGVEDGRSAEEEETEDQSQMSIPRDCLLDAHTILNRGGHPFCVPDILADWRFDRREGASDVRFYAGVSTFAKDGMPVGVIFVANPDPKAPLKREDKDRLLAASKAASDELEALRRSALQERLGHLDQSLFDWAKGDPQQVQHSEVGISSNSGLLAPPIPRSLMNLAARRGARVPNSLSVPSSPNPTTNRSPRHPSQAILQRAVDVIAQTVCGLAYIARVSSDPLVCDVVVRSVEKEDLGQDREAIKSEAAWRKGSQPKTLNPDAAVHLCALAATKRGLAINRDPLRVGELLGQFSEEETSVSPSKLLSTPALGGGSPSTSFESAIIVPCGLKEGGRLWRGTEGWVLAVASSESARLGPELSIYLLRFASLLAPLLLEGPRSPSPVIVPPRSSSRNSPSPNNPKRKLNGSNNLSNPLKSAPLPPLPIDCKGKGKESSSELQIGNPHPYSQHSPSRSPLLQTQPLSAPPTVSAFHPLPHPSPNGVYTFSQRNRKEIPMPSPPPRTPLPLPPSSLPPVSSPSHRKPPPTS